MAKPDVYTEEMFDEFFEKGYWESTTWAEVWDRNAKEYPDKEALVDSSKRLTWGQAKQYTDRWALSFLELGFRRDDALVVQLPNCADISLLRVACEKAGLICMLAMRHWLFLVVLLLSPVFHSHDLMLDQLALQIQPVLFGGWCSFLAC